MYIFSIVSIKKMSCAVIIESVRNFCLKETKGRDDSHGFKHLEDVVKNTIDIMSDMKLNDINIRLLSIIVAYLHDVADHKYDKDGSLKSNMYNFLLNLLKDKNQTDLIMDIIDKISYSKQVKASKLMTLDSYFSSLGKEGKLVRDIVSDADKLEALGKIGLERCIEFIKEKYHEENKSDIPLSLLQKKVKEHSDEKLLLLKDNFIYTNPGKIRALKLHNEFVEELNKFLSLKPV